MSSPVFVRVGTGSPNVYDGGTATPYDGAGYCFSEFNGRRAAALEGQFFAKPKPILRMVEPDTETYARKAFEAERLREWLGV